MARRDTSIFLAGHIDGPKTFIEITNRYSEIPLSCVQIEPKCVLRRLIRQMSLTFFYDSYRMHNVYAKCI